MATIQRATAGMDQVAFERVDTPILAAIAWWFLVIGEAVKALPQHVQARHAAVDWGGFARFRDLLAHQYFRIEAAWLWDAITTALPPLRAAVTAELGRQDEGSRSTSR
jgi:uncharacterized protein